MELLLKCKEDKNILANLKVLNESYIDKIMILQDEIIDSIDDKQIFAKSEKQEFLDAILNKGKILGVVTEENELIAMGVYIKNNYDEHNYGYDIGLEGEELLKVGQIESTVVLPKYRGNNLQRIICQELEKIAIGDKLSILASTASPYNKFSVNTFLKLGYEVKADKLKYGGLRRYVFVKYIK